MSIYRAAEVMLVSTLDAPIPLADWSMELDRIELKVLWCEANDEGPAGWDLTWRVWGWPLNTGGLRDGRVKTRSIRFSTFPPALRPHADALWADAMEWARIHPSEVLNLGTGLLDPERYTA